MEKRSLILGLMLCFVGFMFGQNKQFGMDTAFYYAKVDTNFVFNESKEIIIPRTNVQIQVPEHFIVVEEIPGLVNPASSTSFEFKEYSGTSYIMLDRNIMQQDFEAQSVTFVRREDFVAKNGMTGFMYEFEFEIDGVAYSRLTLVAGDYHNTVWINVNLLKTFKKKLTSLVEECLKTTKIITT